MGSTTTPSVVYEAVGCCVFDGDHQVATCIDHHEEGRSDATVFAKKVADTLNLFDAMLSALRAAEQADAIWEAYLDALPEPPYSLEETDTAFAHAKSLRTAVISMLAHEAAEKREA